ncbi:hypothetical protein [Hyphomonas pacifica]|uniref:Uncharacterized protein n=1 Tax=Hyphomonas pacifica TaxID=1280941 RepID=A0A8B2PJM4_9PROT|nr:hypothetical protein [Hyphomonas pacifica]RAN30638.1 hypothetical protein HY3_05670 [Hyphomonas pacifica]
MAQINRYKVVRKGTQFRDAKTVDLTANQAVSFERAGELELLEENVGAEARASRRGPDAAKLKEEVAALKESVSNLEAEVTAKDEQLALERAEVASLNDLVARIEAKAPDAVKAAKEEALDALTKAQSGAGNGNGSKKGS